MEEKFDLNIHIFRLLINEPFFASISRRINKSVDTSQPTAYVFINPDSFQFEFRYNPDFFKNLNDKERLGVIKHELYHLILGHVTSRKPFEPSDPKKLTENEQQQAKKWNFAADLAINSHISSELPKGCCVPGDGAFKELPNGLAAEAYYRLLNDKMMDKAGGGSQFDLHKWGTDEVDGTLVEIGKERIKEMMRKAVQEVGEAGTWGNVSSQMKEYILEQINPKIDWRKVLRYFIRTSQRAHKSSTVRKLNKRYQYIHPGKRVNRTAKTLICIDQSGSVSDEMLSVFFAELTSLSKIAEFSVLFFDTDVDEENLFVWKKGKRVKPMRTRCGGTDFNAPTDYVNKHPEFDGCIILTDMEAPKPKSSRVPRLWITDETHGDKPYFQTKEKIIKIPNKDLK